MIRTPFRGDRPYTLRTRLALKRAHLKISVMDRQKRRPQGIAMMLRHHRVYSEGRWMDIPPGEFWKISRGLLCGPDRVSRWHRTFTKRPNLAAERADQEVPF